MGSKETFNDYAYSTSSKQSLFVERINLDIPYPIGYNYLVNEGDEMTREFIIMPEFDKQWTAMGLDDTDLLNLQSLLMLNQQVGMVMEGTGGLRKVRFACRGKGTRGGIRVAYVLPYMKKYI